jgi:chemotaxis protein MotB
MTGASRRARPVAVHDEVPEFWVVYSDLLVSLLVVFVLLLFLALTRIEQRRQAERTTARQVGTVRAETDEAIAAAAQSMGDSSISYDPRSRTISVRDEVLFAFGSATLRPEALSLIERLGGRFSRELLATPRVARRIEAIVVEGHTDTVGTYLTNLDLSQRRAQSVMQALVRQAQGQSYEQALRGLLVASGRSEVEAVRPDGSYNPSRARRIVLRVRLRADDLLDILLAPNPAETGIP